MIQSNMCWLVRLLPTCFEYDKIVAMKQLIHREVKLRLPLCNMVVRDYASKSDRSVLVPCHDKKMNYSRA